MSLLPEPKTPAWPPQSAPRLFVETPLAKDATIAFDGAQASYLARVMRVAVGDAVVLCDDQTGEWAARVAEVSRHRVALTLETRLRAREQTPDLWLCAALIKRDRFEWVLEKGCELGVRRIVPVIARRCVARKLNLDRARRIVIEAAEQCARTALPEIVAPVTLDALIADWDKRRALFFADETGGQPAAQAFADRPGPAAILIGPEGGFDSQEREALRDCEGARAIALGPRILRAETAAIAASALWMGVAGDWGRPPRAGKGNDGDGAN